MRHVLENEEAESKVYDLSGMVDRSKPSETSQVTLFSSGQRVRPCTTISGETSVAWTERKRQASALVIRPTPHPNYSIAESPGSRPSSLIMESKKSWQSLSPDSKNSSGPICARLSRSSSRKRLPGRDRTSPASYADSTFFLCCGHPLEMGHSSGNARMMCNSGEGGGKTRKGVGR